MFGHAAHCHAVQDNQGNHKDAQGAAEAQNKAAVGKAGHNVANKAAGSYQDGVWQLRFHMLYVVTAGSGT